MLRARQATCDRHALVVETSPHTAGEVSRKHCHHTRPHSTSGEGASGGFIGKEGCEERGAHPKPNRNEATDILERPSPARSAKQGMYAGGDDLHRGVDGGGDGPAERVPHRVVKPVEEGVPSIVDEILRGAEVEPGVCAARTCREA